MACLVHTDGSLSGCKVRETRRAEAAGVQDVAVCASAGFRIGPVDKFRASDRGAPNRSASRNRHGNERRAAGDFTNASPADQPAEAVIDGEL